MSTESLTTLKSVPGPHGQPVVGSLFSLLKDPLKFAMETHQTYGDLNAVNVGPVRLYFVSHPDYIKHILQDNRNNYSKGTMWNTLRRIFSNGLLASEGEFWLRQRRLMQPAFHRQRLAGLTTLITDTITKMLDSWEEKAQSGEPFPLTHEMTKLTLSVLLNSLFSRGLTAEELVILHDNFRVALKLVNRRLWLFFLPEKLPLPGDRRFRDALAAIDRIIFRVIEERRRSGEKFDDLLSMLLEAQDEDTGETMTDRQLRDEIFVMFLAGHETTALTMTWLWYLLQQHPEKVQKLTQEVDATLNGHAPTFEDLSKLKYVFASVEETLRLYPSAWIIPRTVNEDDVIDGYKLQAGATLLVCPYTLHRNPQFWENPDQFEPERFASERPVNRFAYMPFGAGPRICIGNNFALMEAQLIASMVLQRYKLTVTNMDEIKLTALPTLQPDRPLIAKAERRIQ